MAPPFCCRWAALPFGFSDFDFSLIAPYPHIGLFSPEGSSLPFNIEKPESEAQPQGRSFPESNTQDTLVESLEGDPVLKAPDGNEPSGEAGVGKEIRNLLRLGASHFGLDFGMLVRIDPADGTRVTTELDGPRAVVGHESPGIGEGEVSSLSVTYCRMVLANGETLGVRDAAEEGWAQDPAFQETGLSCYLGTKVVVDGELYGTLCFMAEDPPETPIEETDLEFLEGLARTIGHGFERRRREGELVEARHRLENLEEVLSQVERVAGAAGWILDPETGESRWSSSARLLCGLPDGEEVTFERVLSLLRPDDQAEAEQAVKESLETGTEQAVEVLLTPRDESPRWIELRAVPQARDSDVEGTSTEGMPTEGTDAERPDANGKFLRDDSNIKIMGTLRDITDMRQKMEELRAARQETVKRLAMAGESRDFETGAHTRRVGRLAQALAEGLGAPKSWQEMLREAAPLHDVGKSSVPDGILHKPGPLTGEEQVQMERHATAGARLLAGGESELIRMAERIARSHHERWDGEGYPEGLSGEEIPLEARITSVADAFDAMTTDRPYRDALSVEAALEEIKKEAGWQFDPLVSEAALRIGLKLQDQC